VGFDQAYGDGRYVNEAQANSVTGAMITDGQVSSADIRDTTVNTADLKDGAVTSAKILDGTVTSADIRDTTVNTADIKNAAVTAPKLNQMGASSGQVLKWTGSAWAPANDSTGAGDNAWVRSGSDSVLYTVNRLGIARGGSSNALYGTLRYTHVNLGVQCTTGTSGQNYPSSTVGGGQSNTASGGSATVGGGNSNDATGSSATVGGGSNNAADTTYATVGGGSGNTVSGYIATVGGGYSNNASADYAMVGGGYNNDATGSSATVAGGSGNDATGYAATVAGGSTNAATGSNATVGGGTSNAADTIYATVGGGVGNDASGNAATVAGGSNNAADTTYATVGGGYSHSATGYAATVAGGYDNTATGSYATVAGGYDNTATGSYATVAGGRGNDATGSYATVAGGRYNFASDSFATVAGGYADTSAARWSFTTGRNSVVPASWTNSAAFNGQRATAANQTRVGALSKASGTFTIDHPLDPHGKILNHYFIEGPEMRNIYDGEAVLDASGRAVVTLPDYFDALNRKPRVQLTGVGTNEVVYVAEKVSGNRFVIGGPAGAEVYWQVTGERRDVSAEATRRMMPVEQPKTGDLAGTMLDDDFLSGCMDQLVREGKSLGIDFRTAGGRARYEKMRQHLLEPGQE
jgi:hypothetical protein